MECPCKDCEYRVLNCHSVCEDYKSWHSEINELNKKIQDIKSLNYGIDNLLFSRYTRNKPSRRRR